MEKKKIEHDIRSKDCVAYVQAGNVHEITYLSHRNTECPIIKLNKDEYLVKATGEIKEIKRTETRMQSPSEVRQTLKKMRYLINNNFSGESNELMLTLTYGENMTDYKQLYSDYNKFMKRLCYKLKKDGIKIEYLNVVEPQGRGAWHCHVLIKMIGIKDAYIDHKELEEIWGLGWVWIKRIKNNDNIGAYLTSYLTDLELTQENLSDFIGTPVEIKEVDVDGKKKRFVKGARLKYYPSGINLYRSSRGIIMPEKELITYEKAIKKVGSAKPTYNDAFQLKDTAKDFKMIVSYEYYNDKRE